MQDLADGHRPLSQLSITALVCAVGGVVVPCCPVFPLLAVVLGFVSRARIRRGVPVRGAGMALLAMVLGGLGLLGQGLAFDWVAGRFQEEVQLRSLDRVDRLMRAAGAGDTEATLEAWPRMHGGRPQEVIAFATEAEARYGAFESVSVGGWTYGGDFGEPDLLAAALWRFRDRDLIGTFRMLLVPGTSLADPYPMPVPIELLISDESLGDLRIGGRPPDREAEEDPPSAPDSDADSALAPESAPDLEATSDGQADAGRGGAGDPSGDRDS